MMEPQKKIRILHCIYELNYGGAEKILLGIIANLDQSVFDHQICVFSGTNPYLDKFKSYGVKIHILGMTRAYSYPLMIYKLLRIIKSESIDVIHTNRSTDFFVGTLAGLLARTKTINTLHSNLMSIHKVKDLKNYIWGKILRIFMNYLVEINITVSENVRQFYLQNIEVKNEKILTLYSFFEDEHTNISDIESANYRKEFGIEANSLIFFSVGRLVPEKGYNYLIDAVKIINTQKIDSVFLIAGDGPLHHPLKSVIEQEGLQNLIKILGNRDDIIKLLLFCDVFILASTTEALPIAIVEALSCGKPVIATNVGGVSELVKSQNNGILVDSKSAIKLAAAMAQLMNDYELRSTFGKSSRIVFQEFCSKERTIANYEKLYQQITSIE